MKAKPLAYAVALVVLAGAALAFVIVRNGHDESDAHATSPVSVGEEISPVTSSPASSPEEVSSTSSSSAHASTTHPVIESSDWFAPSVTPSSSSNPGSYDYLFVNNREPMTSNIVGYFGYGAFIWYVPDWLANNWRMTTADRGMIFTPVVRDNPDDFTDISFTIGTSTELFNALNLYQTRLDTIRPSDLVMNEVLLNKHLREMITIVGNIETRIYHIVDRDTDGVHLRDAYYLDGNGQTLIVMFEAKETIFNFLSDHVRDMVEGIGALRGPQG